MDTIGEAKLWTFLDNNTISTNVSCDQIRTSEASFVHNYLDLAKKIAELQFLNRDYVLLFRGQNRDYKLPNGASSLKSSLFRNSNGGPPQQYEIESRFNTLHSAERYLVEYYIEQTDLIPGRDRVIRQRILRWAIIQHYEICSTPLLDVTHSLRIAASFASADNGDEAYIYVLGVPYLSGAVTASAEAGLQIIRLSSVCPPNAMRPHIQEGYLLGEYPDMAAFDQKQHYDHTEVDFGRRLIAKFRFNPINFWKKNKDFPRIKPAALYPDDDDPLCLPLRSIRERLSH